MRREFWKRLILWSEGEERKNRIKQELKSQLCVGGRIDYDTQWASLWYNEWSLKLVK